VLLDVEGTTTPAAFVYEVLFPYARARIAAFLAAHAADPAVRGDLALLELERRGESDPGAPAWDGADHASLVASGIRYCLWLMDRDRKSTALKSLQGRIWEDGFRSGALRGEVYPDVPPALERLRRRGARAAIYSSGSVLAQKLLFSTTRYGDLTSLLAAHFDTTSGPKTEAASYRGIAEELGFRPDEVLFVSDSAAELAAAGAAGLRTTLCVRGAEPDAAVAAGHDVVRSLDGLG
jgi:enolase-phosphatase E1